MKTLSKDAQRQIEAGWMMNYTYPYSRHVVGLCSHYIGETYWYSDGIHGSGTLFYQGRFYGADPRFTYKYEGDLLGV